MVSFFLAIVDCQALCKRQKTCSLYRQNSLKQTFPKKQFYLPVSFDSTTEHDEKSFRNRIYSAKNKVIVAVATFTANRLKVKP